jgi:ATP-binding protein involved in chromosome partitioning
MSELTNALRQRLSAVRDPELGASIVDLGMIGEITVDDQGAALIEVFLTTSSCPLRTQIERDVHEAARVVDGISHVALSIGVLSPDGKAELLRTARQIAQSHAPPTTLRPGVPVLAITSGKGGVGKSSVTANLAVAIARTGRKVGVLDADIWGFSLPRLLGVAGPVEVSGGKMLPITRDFGSGSIHLLSMGFLAEEEQALLWRGLIVQKAVAQFLEDADWSEVDYLIIDTPPGTGDIAMTLARLLPTTQHIVVTTPARAAQRVAARAADFARKSNVRVVGVIENMSGFACECGERHDLFGIDGGRELAEELHVPLLAEIPLRSTVAHGGDVGEPSVMSDVVISRIFDVIAQRIVDEIAPPVGAQGCSARLLQAVESAVAANDLSR